MSTIKEPRPEPREPRPERDLMEAIIRSRIQTEHLLRCVLQGCVGDPCQFCGTPNAKP